jgi:probable HAF family extracellular repeat protein
MMLSIIVCLSMVSGAIPVRGAGSFTFTKINVPGAHFTEAHGINDHGGIVGTYEDTARKSHGFLLAQSRFSNIDFPGAIATEAHGINDHGGIVGTYADTTNKVHGFLFSAGSYSPIDVPGAISTEAFGINAFGQIVGRYFDTASKSHGFLLAQGSFTTIDGPGGRPTMAFGINNLTISPAQPGQIVGEFQFIGSTIVFGFLRAQSGPPSRRANFSPIAFPLGATETEAFGINDHGQIVGTYFGDAGRHGFLIVTSAAGILASTIDVPFRGAGQTQAFGINNGGKIVGRYFDAGGNPHGFLATPKQ